MGHMPLTPTSAPSEPHRVLHLVSTFQIKTDTKWLLQLARHLDRRQFQLSAACFYGGGPIQPQLEAIGVPTYNLGVANEHDPRAIWRARRLIRQIRCDLVHTHLLRADLHGGTAARWAGVPTVVSTAYAIGPYARQRRRRSDRLLDATCARLPTHVVAVSHAVQRDCVERLGIPGDRISVIHTGIEPPEPMTPSAAPELREAWGVHPRQPTVLTVARLSYEKGIDVLIETAATLRRSHPQARILLVGDGPDRPAIEAKIRERGLSETMILGGFLANIWPAYLAASVVCLPSHSEGMPNVLLEAMAVGRPIVATAVGGIPEAILSGDNGLLVPPGNPTAMAGAITRLLNDAELADRLGKAAQATVAQRFLARDAAARYGILYSNLLAQGGRRDGPIRAA